MKIKWFCRNFIIFIIFSLSYYLLEILWRGYSHWTMMILGGICGLLIGLINEITPTMKVWQQMLLGSIIVTILEFIGGCILNIWLGLGIWNYSNMPFNILGQVCLVYTILWFLLSYVVIWLDDKIREKLK
mgnify:CR=1 FL=1